MIGCVFEWLDTHAGAVQAVSTIVLAVLTAVYVWLTKRLVDERAEEVKRRRSRVVLAVYEAI